MNVKNIELKNFKTIESFEHEFNGGVYLITGENEVGKSTLLGAISTLLTGDRSANLLKQGTEKGHAKIVIGEGENQYTVELKFTEKMPRGTLTVTHANGMKSDNKSMLQQIFNYTDFDANEFVSWSNTTDGRRKQVEMIKSLLTEEDRTRLSELESDIKIMREDRKEVNADVKAKSGMVERSGVTAEDIETYSEEIDLPALLQEKKETDQKNLKIQGVKDRIEHRVNDISKLENEIEILKSEITHLQNSQEEAKKFLKENKEVDATEIDEKISKVQDHNSKVQSVQSHQKLVDELSASQKKQTQFNSDITKCEDEKTAIINNSKLPIEGLTFTEEGLFLNKVPFAPGEVSTSQQMEVAAKLVIAKNPTVKVFRIAQGESLGSDRLKAIVEFSEKNGFQGFIEQMVRDQSDLTIEEYKEK